MSGGVDSAVALLQAGAERGGRDAPALDRPERERERAGRAARRRAVIAARQTCHALGHPARHARPARAVPAARSSRRSSRGYARGETPNPCVRCNGSFRFDELLRFARRIGAARLATGHYARIVERDGASRDRPRRRRREGSELHARHASTRRASTGSGSRSASRRRRRRGREAEAAGLAVARRPESQEACFLGGDDYRDVPGPLAASRRRRAGRRRVRPRASATHAGFWRFTPGTAPRARRRAAEPLYVVSTDARTEHGRRRPACVARAAPRQGARPRRRRREPRRGEAPPPVAGGRGDGARRRRAASSWCSTSRSTAWRRDRPPCSTTDGAVVGSGVIVASPSTSH